MSARNGNICVSRNSSRFPKPAPNSRNIMHATVSSKYNTTRKKHTSVSKSASILHFISVLTIRELHLFDENASWSSIKHVFYLFQQT